MTSLPGGSQIQKRPGTNFSEQTSRTMNTTGQSFSARGENSFVAAGRREGIEVDARPHRRDLAPTRGGRVKDNVLECLAVSGFQGNVGKGKPRGLQPRDTKALQRDNRSQPIGLAGEDDGLQPAGGLLLLVTRRPRRGCHAFRRLLARTDTGYVGPLFGQVQGDPAHLRQFAQILEGALALTQRQDPSGQHAVRIRQPNQFLQGRRIQIRLFLPVRHTFTLPGTIKRRVPG